MRSETIVHDLEIISQSTVSGRLGACQTAIKMSTEFCRSQCLESKLNVLKEIIYNHAEQLHKATVIMAL